MASKKRTSSNGSTRTKPQARHAAKKSSASTKSSPKSKGGKKAASSARSRTKAPTSSRGSKILGVLDRGTVRDPGLSDERLLELYATMVRTRVMEERALVLQRQGRIGFYVPCTGQEASHIGTAAALMDSDWIFPAYRQAGIPLLRGVSMEQIVDEWYGNDGDICKGRQMPVHYSFRSAHFVTISSPIGTQLSHAVGAAMAAKYRGEDTVTMTYCGDGGTSENDFHCALNFAGVYASPCVFICENNGWAISTPLEYQTASETMAVKAEAYGIPGVRVDGNDILAVYQVTKEAVDRARQGKGPTLIESLTYRVGPHSSSDDPTRYRGDAEVTDWKNKDPLERFKKYLRSRRLLTPKQDEALFAAAKEEVNAAVKAAEQKPNPTVSSMFDDVYRDLTPQLREQRDELLSLGEAKSEHEGYFPL
ncbi:MAG: pyruvate dehydrogenase (acetyl-transferring) E1 component subunit alpha [Planctomycetes bacterium]|nr:pyruvate dehydrogenase (acetyl-transferring) E1 component subunit alpha [Planctomycetota bacterium]MCB9919516.1 pyruvate dehydrogenase (acetyl-transferring) E1 component subunit alpha [Planctomycetota bacterium]